MAEMEIKGCSHPGCKNKYVAIAVVLSPEGVPTQTAFCKNHLQNLGMNFVPPDLSHYDPQTSGNFEECRLYAILFWYDGNRYDVVLRGLQTNSVFFVPIPYVHAMALFYAVTKQGTSQYPLTHQLLTEIIRRLGGTPGEIVVHGYNKNQDAYDCYLSIGVVDGLIKVNSTVGDAIVLSLHTGIRIKINVAFFGKDLNAISH
jgi:bifunctional DNase/RNase